MYRAPEMVDTWNNYPIGCASDVWALGCLLYLLCFNKHPFEDSAKLRILNANYSIPAGDSKYADFHALISEYSQLIHIQKFLLFFYLKYRGCVIKTTTKKDYKYFYNVKIPTI